jgi:hypothetical protein
MLSKVIAIVHSLCYDPDLFLISVSKAFASQSKLTQYNLSCILTIHLQRNGMFCPSSFPASLYSYHQLHASSCLSTLANIHPQADLSDTSTVQSPLKSSAPPTSKRPKYFFLRDMTEFSQTANVQYKALGLADLQLGHPNPYVSKWFVNTPMFPAHIKNIDACIKYLNDKGITNKIRELDAEVHRKEEILRLKAAFQAYEDFRKSQQSQSQEASVKAECMCLFSRSESW